MRLDSIVPLQREGQVRFRTAAADATLVGRSYPLNLTNYLLSITMSLGIGLVGFVLAYKIFDWLTPGITFQQQLREGNRAVAIFLAGLFIGLGLLLGSAVK
jgi:hypothetical protein